MSRRTRGSIRLKLPGGPRRGVVALSKPSPLLVSLFIQKQFLAYDSFGSFELSMTSFTSKKEDSRSICALVERRRSM